MTIIRGKPHIIFTKNWNNYEPFVYIVNTERCERPDLTTIIRAYSNTKECRLYINGEPYGESITDVNTEDAVADDSHIFMWYDVPLSGSDTIEVRAIQNDTETATSLDTNGEVVFTTAFSETSIKSLSDKLTVSENTIILAGGVNDISVADITNKAIVQTLPKSVVSVLDNNKSEVSDKYLAEGMTIRVTGENGAYADYIVTVGALDMSVSTSSNSDAAGKPRIKAPTKAVL